MRHFRMDRNVVPCPSRAMKRKDALDGFGIGSLILVALLLAFNQVVIRVVNEGLNPVFFAGLRSAGAMVCITIWMWARGVRFTFDRIYWPSGIIIGCVFSAQFACLFLALDLTSVVRTGVIFYSMPIWLAVGAHFLLGERITRPKAFGFLLAFAGVGYAIWSSANSGGGALAGDFFALAGALSWAAVALLCRLTKLSEQSAEMQLYWQVGVSTVLLTGLAPLFGDLIRDLQPIHLWGLGFQSVVVVSAGFIFWLWLLKIYPAASVASFSFLSPVFAVILGWALLGEDIGWQVGVSLILVVAGLIMINRRAKPMT